MKKLIAVAIIMMAAAVLHAQKDTAKKFIPVLIPIDASKIKFTPKPALSGWVDLHTHPMSHLAFGRKIMHGAPDIGCIIPAGTYNCNPTDFRATTIEQALHNCNSTHGGWGVDNTCGDYIRAAVLNFGLDDKFVHKSSNPHGDHDHDGYPNFTSWPHQTSISHQQMWWEWIKRAYDGGLRVMVALAVNSEILAEVVNGDNPKDDKGSADLQVAEIKTFVGRHRDFMEVAYTSADVRRIVGSNKMAVILGMEVDNIGNFNKRGLVVTPQMVKDEIQRVYRNGVRYIFPIHLVDNKFGGTAVYNMLFNFANNFSTGSFFKVAKSPDTRINYNLDMTSGVIGAENALILGLKATLIGIGQIPAPCFNDAIKCFPPPGKVMCCGSFEKIVNMITPSGEFEDYKRVTGGQVNVKGLSSLGEVAVREMMKLGMMIDIDHMSDLSKRRTIEIAEGVNGGGYPLNVGHNGVRNAGEEVSERSIDAGLTARVSRLGGVFGVGTANTDPQSFISSYTRAWTTMGSRAVMMGTDANGMEPLPKSSPGLNSATFYSGGFTKSRTAGKEWDYTTDGVAHYGLMSDFVRDLKTKPGGATVVDNLYKSAEYFAQMWEKCESQSRQVDATPRGGTFTLTPDPIGTLCPYNRTGGDTEFGGNGPRVVGNVTLTISPDGTYIMANINITATETGGDHSEVRGAWSIRVGDPAPEGLKYTSINSVRTTAFDKVLVGGGRNEVFEGCDGGTHIIETTGAVARLLMVGDTGGGDISTDADCNCDTRIVRVELNPVTVTVAAR